MLPNSETSDSTFRGAHHFKFQSCSVSYFRKFNTDIWAPDFLKLAIQIEKLVGIDYTHIYYSYDVEKLSSKTSKDYDAKSYNILKKRRDKVLQNFEQIVKTKKIRTLSLTQNIDERERIYGSGIVVELVTSLSLKFKPYHIIYIQVPDRIWQPFLLENRIKFITQVFDLINEYFQIEYGLSTQVKTEYMPSAYFGDLRPHHISESLFHNMNLWSYNKDKMPYKLRDIYPANFMSEEHIKQLGGYDKALIDLHDILDTNQIHEIAHRNILFFVEDSQKLRIREYFEQKNVLLVGEPPTKWFIDKGVVRGE